MGIKHLRSYLFDNKQIQITNIKDAADSWRVSGGSTVLLVDCLNILSHVVDYSETLCCGGEYPALEAKFEKIIKAFKDISIDLVFFLDGPVTETRLDVWKGRRIKKMLAYQEFFEKIPLRKVGGFAEAEVFPNLATRVAKETAKAHCLVIKPEGDPDLAMAQYVIRNKCLGVITEDTDFLVFEGIPHIFLSKSLVKGIFQSKQFDPRKWTVSEYLQTEFLKSVGLESKAFPIFATLAGNDSTCQQTMVYFRRRFNAEFLSTVAVPLANIANNIYRESHGDQETAACYLAEELYENRDYKDLMLKSLRSYDLQNGDTKPSVLPVPLHSVDERWNQLVCKLLTAGNKVGKSIQHILLYQMYTLSERFEDNRKPCAIVLRDLRRRIYGVVLHEKSGEREYVEECIATTPQCFDGQKRYLESSIVVEGVDHPGMWTLVNGGAEFDEIRWRIVWWAMCPAQAAVSYEKFRNLVDIPDEMKIAGLTVFYLYGILKEITQDEASIIILMIGALLVYSSEKLKEISMVQEFTTKRACSLATLYQETFANVRRLTRYVCGLKLNSRTSRCYSGHFFHWLLKFQDISQLYNRFPSEVWDKFSLLNEALEKSL